MIDYIAEWWVIPFLIVITPLVFFHELGHYLAARACNVRVEIFSVGFGREIFGWNDRYGTRWKIALIPIGGYVKMFGEMQYAAGESSARAELSEEESAVAFHTKSIVQRAFIVVAGPMANLVLAVIILSGIFMTMGQPYTPSTIGSVLSGSAAENAGFVAGDKIISVNERAVRRFEEVREMVLINPGVTLTFLVERGRETVQLIATPDIVNVETGIGKQRYGRLGVSAGAIGQEMKRHGVFSAVLEGAMQTYVLTENIFTALGQIISGTRKTEELAGPIRIAKMSSDVWKLGFINVLMLAAILSINLGIVNLFPVPLLDGGHLFLYAIEALRGRPLGLRAQEYSARVGILLLLALMLFVTFNDIRILFDQFVEFFTRLI